MPETLTIKLTSKLVINVTGLRHWLPIAVFSFALIARIILEISPIFSEKCRFLGKLAVLTPGDLHFTNPKNNSQNSPSAFFMPCLVLKINFYRFIRDP